ncbi:MAG: hypothetical protein ACI4A5_11190, partial [Hominilimicola sp.]
KYRIHEDFENMKVKDINEEACVFTDIYGKRVLHIMEHLPIFDSGDSMYNSFEEIYILENGTGIYRRGGWASVTDLWILNSVEPKGDKAKKMFEQWGSI